MVINSLYTVKVCVIFFHIFVIIIFMNPFIGAIVFVYTIWCRCNNFRQTMKSEIRQQKLWVNIFYFPPA
jgi:hypothetical protein